MTQTHPSAPETTKSESTSAPVKPAFERPELKKRGELPKVTTAFGGSFIP